MSCTYGRYFIDAAFTNQWKVNSTEESSIVAIDDHNQFDAYNYKQLIYFMTRFKTADSANSYTNNWAFEVHDSTYSSSETRNMKMVSIDTWNLASDGRQEFII